MFHNFLSRLRNDRKGPQEQDRFANPTTITETIANFCLNRTATNEVVWGWFFLERLFFTVNCQKCKVMLTVQTIQGIPDLTISFDPSRTSGF